jgi:hypothetical protein
MMSKPVDLLPDDKAVRDTTYWCDRRQSATIPSLTSFG